MIWVFFCRLSLLQTKPETLTALHVLVIFRHVVRFDVTQETNVIVRMEFCHFVLCRLVWPLFNRKKNNQLIPSLVFIGSEWAVKITYVDLHLAIQPIVEQQIVCHTNAMWLHGMALAIIIITNIAWKSNFEQLKFIQTSSENHHSKPTAFHPHHLHILATIK